MDDAALQRLDVWTDGGIRDLFNFHVAAQHLTGSLVNRGRPAAIYTDVSFIPGQDRTMPGVFNAEATRWDEVPRAAFFRYGPIDPTVADLQAGLGQHVGSADEVLQRLQTAFYYIGAHWPDVPYHYYDSSSDNPDPNASQCEVNESCLFNFTDSLGRVGPVQVTLPTGYANASLLNVRYPVIYVLHGYGQTPDGFAAASLFLIPWMNSGLDSSATRLAKAIVVYVDGHCRFENGSSECLEGNFYVDSPRATGSKGDTWFSELMTEIDTRYRTMPTTTVSWTE